MEKGQDIIIHFSGILNLDLAKKVDVKISENPFLSARMIFDFSQIDSVMPDGAKRIEDLCQKIENGGGSIVFSGLKYDFFGHCKNKLPAFPGLDEAKQSFSTMSHGQKLEDSSISNFQHSHSIFCPSCHTLLNAPKKGNYFCPSCKTRFFVHENRRISKFEKLL